MRRPRPRPRPRRRPGGLDPKLLPALSLALLGLVFISGCPAGQPAPDAGDPATTEAGAAEGATREAPGSEAPAPAPGTTTATETESKLVRSGGMSGGGGGGGAFGARSGRVSRLHLGANVQALPEAELLDAEEVLVFEEDLALQAGLAANGKSASPQGLGVRTKNKKDIALELADAPNQRDDGATPEKPLVPQGFEAGQGSLLARDADGDTLGDFPLKHTDVKAEISGFLASTLVRQTFGNPYAEPIEAVYVFPLPTSAAINDFVMQIGERKIVGVVRPREEAERIYAEARARGQTASLLTQERPNIFTQNVANIEPGGEVVIHIRYFHTLRYEKGTYEYTFPMVVGPRYMPGGAKGPDVEVAGARADDPVAGDTAKVGGDGTAVPTDQVPDADRISPPVLREGERSGHDISLLVDIDAGVPLGDVAVPTHEVHVERATGSRVIVRLAERDSIPNRDFVLRAPVAGDAPTIGFLAHRSEAHGGFFTLMLVPQLDPRDADVTPREVTFVLDTSGSMRGIPMAMSKDVVQRTLSTLRPEDRFNVIRFAGDAGMLSPTPLDNTPDNVARGLAYVEAMQGSGGTEMLKGIRAYLETPRDPRFLRVVCFLTDGYVGNEPEILRVIKEEGQDARWFAFGVGSSVNRYLIGGIGAHGNGASQYVLPREDGHAERAVETFFRRIDSPVLVDIDVDTEGLPIADVYPRKLNDLFAGQPIVLKGRYTGAARGRFIVRGRVGQRLVEIPVDVTLPEVEERNAALAPVWARRKIADLSGDLLSKPGDEALTREITDLAVEFRLVSQFTSFVAVDESRIVGDGRPVKVLVPVEIPEDVDREGAVGGDPVGQAVRADGWGLVLREFRDASVRVIEVTGGGVCDGKVRVGDRLATVGRTQIRGLRHLEALLLQEGGARMEIGFRPETDPQGPVFSLMLPQP